MHQEYTSISPETDQLHKRLMFEASDLLPYISTNETVGKMIDVNLEKLHAALDTGNEELAHRTFDRLKLFRQIIEKRALTPEVIIRLTHASRACYARIIAHGALKYALEQTSGTPQIDLRLRSLAVSFLQSGIARKKTLIAFRSFLRIHRPILDKYKDLEELPIDLVEDAIDLLHGKEEEILVDDLKLSL